MRAASWIIYGCFAVQIVSIATIVYRENFGPAKSRLTGSRLKPAGSPPRPSAC